MTRKRHLISVGLGLLVTGFHLCAAIVALLAGDGLFALAFTAIGVGMGGLTVVYYYNSPPRNDWGDAA